MDQWSPKFKLISVLATTKELLIRSESSIWTNKSPPEAAQEIDKAISHLMNPEQNLCPMQVLILYAPTGSIQEIAISNGWHDAYMALAKEYDSLDYLFQAK